MLRPAESDYFVLKPKHSAFYATTLDLLLEHLRVETLILTGIAANICVLFTANHAYMRDYRLLVPSNCIAANTIEDTNYSLRQMKTILKSDVEESNTTKSTAEETIASAAGATSKANRAMKETAQKYLDMARLKVNLDDIEEKISGQPLLYLALATSAGFILGGGMGTNIGIMLLGLFSRRAAAETATNFGRQVLRQTISGAEAPARKPGS